MRQFLVLVPGLANGLLQLADSRAEAVAGVVHNLGLASAPQGTVAVAIQPETVIQGDNAPESVFCGKTVDGFASYLLRRGL
jgi:hypothetical protein